MPFLFQVAGFWTGNWRKYEGFGTAYAHKRPGLGLEPPGGWLNLGERKWLNSGERHRSWRLGQKRTPQAPISSESATGEGVFHVERRHNKWRDRLKREGRGSATR
jgi:hypothetical protein